MTAREYLSRARRLDALIGCRLREIDYWRRLSRSVSGMRLDGTPRAPGCPADASFVRCIEKIDQIRRSVEEKAAQLIALRDEINSRIDMLESREEQLVLRYRYLDNHTWEEIERLMNVSGRTVFRIHGSALQNFSVPD